MTFSILCGMVNDIVIDEVIKKKKMKWKTRLPSKGHYHNQSTTMA